MVEAEQSAGTKADFVVFVAVVLLLFGLCVYFCSKPAWAPDALPGEGHVLAQQLKGGGGGGGSGIGGGDDSGERAPAPARGKAHCGVGPEGRRQEAVVVPWR
jgi:hypothetical protein